MINNRPGKSVCHHWAKGDNASRQLASFPLLLMVGYSRVAYRPRYLHFIQIPRILESVSSKVSRLGSFYEVLRPVKYHRVDVSVPQILDLPLLSFQAVDDQRCR
jgi:hypothetical protein